MNFDALARHLREKHGEGIGGPMFERSSRFVRQAGGVKRLKRGQARAMGDHAAPVSITCFLTAAARA
jgi:hypothetical protein